MIKKIFKGWLKLLFATREERELSKMRKKVCRKCIYENKGICEKCGCFLIAKSLLKNEECPIGKWQ